MTTSAELAEATPAQVAAARTALSGYLQALYPALSLGAGQLADLVLNPAADALAGVEAVAARRAAALDPYTALAEGVYDQAALAAALAGLGVARGEAATAAGTAALIFSADVAVTIPSAYRLKTADGVEYRPAAGTQIRPTGASVVLATDVRLAALPEGGYVAAVPVTAAAAGASGNRPAGTTLTPNAALTNQTAAYLAADAAGGADAETDAALLARLPAASAPRTVGSVAGIQGVVLAASAVVSRVAVQGYGHPGLFRARSALGLQAPGKADARVRVGTAPARLVVQVTATYQGLVGPYGSWRFSLAAGAVPGWFRVEKAIQRGAKVTVAGYAPTAVTRGFDLTGAVTPPDVRTAADAAYSAYSTALVTFTDPDTATAGLTANVSTRAYDAVVRTVPGVAAAQAAVRADGVRASGGDCLVRAAVPVLVTVTAVAVKPSGATLTAAAVAAAVARAVNETDVSPTLSGARVAAAALAYLPAGTSLTLSDWAGTAYAQVSNVALSGSAGLTVSTDWANGLGVDAVAFYADVEGVTASVT